MPGRPQRELELAERLVGKAEILLEVDGGTLNAERLEITMSAVGLQMAAEASI